MIEIEHLDLLQRFGASLGIGVLMGLVRERRPGTLAGLRTFSLIALLGTLGGLLSERAEASWLLPAALLVLGAMMIAADRNDEAQEPGTTSTVAVLLCFCLGAMVWFGPLLPAVALGLLSTALLHFKPALSGFATRLTPADISSLLRFAAVSLLVLPILPDQGYGPYGALNPYRIWLMVVLISGLSLGGYLLLQIIGAGRGVVLIGVLGGLVSSTATSLTFSRQVRDDPEQLRSARLVILIANLVVLLRLAALALAVSPAALPALAPMLGCGFLFGAIVVLWTLRRTPSAEQGALVIRNPGEMRAALSFAGLYAVVLVGVAWMEDRVGEGGVYLAAAVSGLTDLDAISLSAMEMFNTERLDSTALSLTLLIAYGANLLFKLGLVYAVAGRALAVGLIGGFAAAAAGLGLGWLV